MKKVVQKRIIKVVQPGKVEYYCDACGARCGTRSNPKEEWYSIDGKLEHYCKRGCNKGW